MERLGIAGYPYKKELLTEGSTIVIACNNTGGGLVTSEEIKDCNVLFICPFTKDGDEGNVSNVKRVFAPSHLSRQVYKGEGFVSTCDSHELIDSEDSEIMETLPMTTLSLYSEISLIILDLYGEEYKVCKSLDGPRQVSVRFHHPLTKYTQQDTDRMIGILQKKKYALVHNKDKSAFIECLFVKQD